MLRLLPDQRLIEAVGAGSDRAFEAIFDRHHKPVLAFCRQMLGSFEEAEDAAQLTFLAAYRDLVRSERPQALRPWLYGIARHRCLSLLRARREHPVSEVPEPTGDTLGLEVDRREELRGILADLARLPDDQRAALVLAELRDISHEDIARILDCPRSKVKALVFQARSSLVLAREARETPCAVIREQLCTLRGGALRRATLRRHVHDCPGCRAFREQLRLQRRRLGLIAPIMPSVGLKRAVIGGLLGAGGGGAGGVAVTTAGLGAGGLAAAALVTVAIPLGGITAAVTGWRDDGRAAVVDARDAARPKTSVAAQPGDLRRERAAPPPLRTLEHRVRSRGAERVRHSPSVPHPDVPARRHPGAAASRPSAPEQTARSVEPATPGGRALAAGTSDARAPAPTAPRDKTASPAKRRGPARPAIARPAGPSAHVARPSNAGPAAQTPHPSNSSQPAQQGGRGDAIDGGPPAQAADPGASALPGRAASASQQPPAPAPAARRPLA